jgi:hypothetical protein
MDASILEDLYLPIISSVPFILINVKVCGILLHNPWKFSGENPSLLPPNNNSNSYGKHNSLV